MSHKNTIRIQEEVIQPIRTDKWPLALVTEMKLELKIKLENILLNLSIEMHIMDQSTQISTQILYMILTREEESTIWATNSNTV